MTCVYILTIHTCFPRIDISPTTSKKNKTPKPECLSCGLEPPCTYATSTFSKNTKFYVLQCLGPGVPYTLLKSTDGKYSEYSGIKFSEGVTLVSLNNVATVEYVK
jgi:hypothetical protein